MKSVTIDYTNWKGERRKRSILPLEIRFWSTIHHPEPQWLLEAVDLESGDTRFFALSGIHSWEAS